MWYKKAFINNDAYSLCCLGQRYADGMGFGQNYTKAVMLYKKAAEQNDAWALYLLGECYECGDGVAQNIDKAFELFKKAAEQEETQAQLKLVDFYMQGKVVNQSYDEAYTWLARALDNHAVFMGNDLKTTLSNITVPSSYDEIVEQFNWGLLTWYERILMSLRFLQHWHETQGNE